VRTKLLNKVDFSMSVWNSYLSSELVFVGDEGTFEPSGASRRQGIESEVRYDILSWLSFDSDISYTWAKFVNGDKVPLAPRFLAYTGLTARHDSALQGRIQMRHIGRRYGNEDGSFVTPTSTIFDLFLKYVWKRYEIFLEFQNLANTKWRSAQHVFESRTPNELAAGLPGQNDLNYTPGDPFTVKAGITIHMW
jgi:outer membrane receptor protein involved in Fe transport